MVLSTHCYRDSLCVSVPSMRPVCNLHDCSQIKMPFGNRTPFFIQGMVDLWFGLLSYVCIFYTPFNVKIPMPNFVKMHHLKWRITTIFWEGAVPPPRTPSPRSLDARAFHGQMPRMSSDPRNVPGCDAALWKVEPLIQISQSLLQLQRIAKVVYSVLNY